MLNVECKKCGWIGKFSDLNSATTNVDFGLSTIIYCPRCETGKPLPRKMDPKRILKVIEGLTLGEIEHEDPQKTLDQIYTFAHLAGNCEGDHKDWKEDFLKMEKALIKHGIVGKRILDQ